jgi:hypothetical protein
MHINLFFFVIVAVMVLKITKFTVFISVHYCMDWCVSKCVTISSHLWSHCNLNHHFYKFNTFLYIFLTYKHKKTIFLKWKLRKQTLTISHVVYLSFIGNTSKSSWTELLMKYMLNFVIGHCCSLPNLWVLCFCHCWNCWELCVGELVISDCSCISQTS